MDSIRNSNLNPNPNPTLVQLPPATMADSGAAAAPTGCYKCGRPGHWSRDCPSSNPNPNPNPNPSSSSSFSKVGHGGTFQKPIAPVAKPKKAPRTRPKVTPELLLSDEGIGYILRYFPRNFKYRGRGHEVSDLRNLLHMYAEWHSQFLPYFPFDQFIHKVEEAGGSRRVRTCIAELKERVANGGDPTKLRESATENETTYDKEDAFHSEEPTQTQDEFAFNENVAEDMQEDILNEIFSKTVEETSDKAQGNNVVADQPPMDKSVKGTDQTPETGGGNSSADQLTEEQKALMEAKRLKALERAAARSRLLRTS